MSYFKRLYYKYFGSVVILSVNISLPHSYYLIVDFRAIVGNIKYNCCYCQYGDYRKLRSEYIKLRKEKSISFRDMITDQDFIGISDNIRNNILNWKFK